MEASEVARLVQELKSLGRKFDGEGGLLILLNEVSSNIDTKVIETAELSVKLSDILRVFQNLDSNNDNNIKMLDEFLIQLRAVMKEEISDISLSTTTSIKELNDSVKIQLKTYKKDLNSAINDFNERISLSNNMFGVSAFLAGGLIGAIILTFFSLNGMKEKVYAEEFAAQKEYIQKIAEYDMKTKEMEEKYKNADELSKMARILEIQFQKEKNGEKFLFIPKENVKQYVNDKFQVWKFN